MITCPKCGTSIPDGTAFCSNCGTAIPAAADSAAPETVTPASEPAASTPTPTPAPAPAPDPAYSRPDYNQAPMGGYGQPAQQPYYGDPSDHTFEFDPEEIVDNKIFAVTAYLFGFLGIIVALLAGRDSRYVKFHVRQSLKLSIASVLAIIPAIIPILGWIVMGVLLLILTVIEIMAIVWAFQGKSRDLPLIKDIRWLN